MKTSRMISAAFAALLATVGSARAATFSFDFSGPGVSGSLLLTYGTATDAKYSSAFEVSAVSGTFSDSNSGLNIVDAPVGALVPITHDAPESSNLLAPNDFSRFPVASGLAHGAISFDNLLYPGGSPQTASSYPVSGGYFDIYGLLFDIGGGRAVNVWSNGDFGTGHADYGVAVVTSRQSLDYVEGGVTAAVPEPGTVWMVGAGLLALLAFRRRARDH